jgi:hypothetical protein
LREILPIEQERNFATGTVRTRAAYLTALLHWRS